jgi:starvation-inducible DNA-binding protein
VATKVELNPTLNDLSGPTRAQMIDLLNQNLADILDLGMQAKYAHWNVKGPSFIALHELYDTIAEELAERAVKLGGTAQGLLQGVAAWVKRQQRTGSLRTRSGCSWSK